jgi:hypothetical protein
VQIATGGERHEPVRIHTHAHMHIYTHSKVITARKEVEA